MMKINIYNNRNLRITGAFIASFFIIFHGRQINLHKALSSASFYIIFTISFAIALLLVFIVHRATLWLDVRFDWKAMPLKRVALQFALGIMAPAIADLLLISIYFKAIGQDVITNGFLLIDYPVIVALLIIANLYYLIHYQHNLIKSKTKAAPVAETEDRSPFTLTIHSKGIHMILDVRDVLYFYRTERKVMAYTVHGNEYPTGLSLTGINNLFQQADFYQINRSVIINSGIVSGYESGKKRDILRIMVKPGYTAALKHSQNDLLVVTKEHIRAFKDRFQH